MSLTLYGRDLLALGVNPNYIPGNEDMTSDPVERISGITLEYLDEEDTEERPWAGVGTRGSNGLGNPWADQVSIRRIANNGRY